jgi:hypothetical protein
MTACLLTPGLRLHGATYAGICTAPNGALYALLLQDRKPEGRLTWEKAMAWAARDGASDLPSRPEAALLFQVLKAKLDPRWHWTNETCSWDASFAWLCDFCDGNQDDTRKRAEGSCVAVRRLPLESFDSLVSLAAAAEVPA